MVDVTFLGTGGAFCAGRRSNLALLIESGDFCMLVEAGPVIMQQLTRAKIPASQIERVFVSHSHGDHALGFPMLALNRLWEPPPLHVYAGTSTVASLKALLGLAYPGFDDDHFNLHWHELPEQGSEETELTADVTLRTVVVPHPPGVPTLAARWDFAGGLSVTFVTDTVPNDAIVGLARDSDLLIHEANFSATLQPNVDTLPYFHSTAQQAGEIARRARCPRLALVHLGSETGEQPDVLAAEARAGTDLQVIVPEDGERIRLSDGE
ncbi:MAG: MBL fold metallo-hydrolase [Chloroflexota bacterium]|nr:MBL fold metallo-hydrolase [Chloroflexota bacterium]